MEDQFRSSYIIAFAKNLYQDVEPLTPEEKLNEFLEQCANHNLTVFLSSFVCDDLFGHSRPDRLRNEDIDVFIKHADPFLQTAILQRGLLS